MNDGNRTTIALPCIVCGEPTMWPASAGAFENVVHRECAFPASQPKPNGDDE